MVLFFLYAVFVYFSQKELGGAGEEEGLKRRGEGCCVATSWLREAARERGQQPRQVLRLTWKVGRGN